MATRTNPANLVSVWNAIELQEDDPAEKAGGYRKRLNEQALMSLFKKHRAIEFGLSLTTRKKVVCRCIAVLESEVEYWNIEGKCLLNTKSFLLLGLEASCLLSSS